MILAKRLLIICVLLYCVHANAEISAGNLFALSGYGSGALDETSRHLGFLWQQDLFADWGDPDIIQLSGNLSTHGTIDLLETPDYLGMDVYRLWGSISRRGTELRIGLQQINFGPARIHRPEKWFDELVPLDPLQLTAGVNAALLRHYYGSNSAIWIWGALTDETSGSSEEDGSDNLNMGGRAEFPLLGMESGVSLNLLSRGTELTWTDQIKLGADIRYDGFIGAWLESSASQTKADPDPKYYAEFTLGADYTLGIGNGLYLLQETNLGFETPEVKKRDTINHANTSVLISYPLGLLDNLQLLGSRDHRHGAWDFNLLWRRTYDYLSWDLGIAHRLQKGFCFKPTYALRLNLNI